jgi:hypothetical protein
MPRLFARVRYAFAVFLVVAAATFSGILPARADAAGNPPAAQAIAGTVADAQSGLPLPDALVRLVGSTTGVTTGSDGTFVLNLPAGGTYRVRIEHDGYQPTDSDPIPVTAGATTRVTLAIQTTPSQNLDLKTIGSTSVRSTQSLQRSTTIYRTLSPETLLESGTFRFGDALRTLPGITNSIPGDTAALGDDINLELRGIGANETTATLDGHPIGYGVKGGFNYQLSPTFGLKGISVLYGSSGTDLTGYDAIGGIIDSQTIDPTIDSRYTFTTGAGTFGKLGSNFTATGTVAHKLGYALSYGVSTVDGPFNNDYLYQPGAAYDPSATDPAVHELGIYKDDSSATTRSGLLKLRYDLSAATHLTLTSVASSYWEDKTGNGDGDYLTPGVALLDGKGLLTNKSAKDPCPPGEFTATNANGVPWGTGPGGIPDGGSPCQTPASYASSLSGLQGAGPAWQAFNFNDEALHFDSTGAHTALRMDAFTNRYLDTGDRKYQLPFTDVSGDTGSFSNTQASSDGASLSENFFGANNEVGVGLEYTNYAYKFQRSFSLRGAPIVNEVGEFVREAYHPQKSPLAAYAAAYFKHDSATDTSYVDPRLSVVYSLPGGRDVVRVASGATTTEPSGDELDQQFTASSLVTAGGGGGINCSATNSIGSAPSAVLKPERGVDEEVAYGHRFSGDSQVQFAAYNTNVYDKILSTISPLALTGTGFIDPDTLARAQALAASQCGGSNFSTLFGVTGNVNIGQFRAQGFTINGRQRISPATFFDYDAATTSTTVRSAPVAFFQHNLTDVQDSQLPRIPLHTLNFSADTLARPGIDVRYTLHVVGDNNTKRIAGYNYSDLRISAGNVGPGTFSVAVTNLFQQNAFIEGYLNEGEALALNQYATRADYAPYTGSGETELFGLPYRSIYFTYSLSVR